MNDENKFEDIIGDKNTVEIKSAVERIEHNKNKNYRKKKCKAKLKNCNTVLKKCKNCGKVIDDNDKKTRHCSECGEDIRCLYHFKKGENVCPMCGSERPACNNWAVYGYDVCRMHGAGGGRKLENMDTSYKVSTEPKVKKRKKELEKMEFDLDDQLNKVMSIVDKLRDLIEKDEEDATEMDIQKMMSYTKLLNDFWKGPINIYHNILHNKKIIERVPPDIDRKIKKLMEATEKRAVYNVLDGVFYALERFGLEKEKIKSFKTYLPSDWIEIYKEYDDNSNNEDINIIDATIKETTDDD